MSEASREPHDLATSAAVGDFVEMWLVDQQNGSVRRLRDYLSRFSGFEEAIAREYVQLTQPALDAVTIAGDDAAMIGEYRTIRVLGHGGQGTVWLTEDKSLGRQVAVKVLSTPPELMSTARVERLRREAQTLARLDHPGICAIYEANFAGAQPYIAMRYVDGETIAATLKRREQKPLARAEVGAWLPFFASAAMALQAAHALGVVHRDIKPGNLMRTVAGEPVVLDFGLAYESDSSAVSLTQSGELFGTLPYMAPEMLLARGCDHRVDVYALGVVLFEVVTGVRPFSGATHAALRHAIEYGDATGRQLLLDVAQSDLALVIMTAIERDPDRRYRTAEAFAEDLRRVHAGDAIAARPLRHSVRIKRALLRHPVLASSAALVLIGLIAAIVLLYQLDRGRSQLLALRLAYQAQALAADQPGAALHIVTEAALAEPHPEINDILFQVLDSCWEEHALVRTAHDPGTTSPWIETTADDRFIVLSRDDGTVALVDARTGTIDRVLRHASYGYTVAAVFGTNGVLTGGHDGVLRLFDIDTGACRRSWQVHQKTAPDQISIACIRVAPDGQRIGSSGADGRVAMVRADSERIDYCSAHNGGVDAFEFAPDGTRIATISGHRSHFARGDRTVRVYPSSGGEPLQVFGPFEGPMRSVAWSSDGHRLVIAQDRNRADICDVETGAILAALPHGGTVYWADFSNDDQQVVTGSSDGLSIFDVVSRALVKRHADFRDRSVFRGAFDKDGSHLAVISWDDTARIYETATWREDRVLRGVTTRALGLCWNRAANRVITVGSMLQTWYAQKRPFLPSLNGHRERVTSATFSADGLRVLTASIDGDARVWDSTDGTLQRTLAAGGPLVRARFTPAGAVLAIRETGPAVLFSADAPIPLGSIAANDGWPLDNAQILLAGVDGTLRWHEPSTGAVVSQLPVHKGRIVSTAFHAGRRWLATGGSDRTYCIVDLDRHVIAHRSSQWQGGTVGEREHVFGLTFDPAGKFLYAACEDMLVRVVDLDGQFSCRTTALGPTPGNMFVSRDGMLLVVAAQWSGRLQLVDTRQLGLVGVAAAQHSNLIVGLEQQQNGHLALSASKDGTVAIFDPLQNRLLSQIHAASGPLCAAHFSPDGTRIVTAAADGAVRIWPTDPLAVAVRVRPARMDMSLQQR